VLDWVEHALLWQIYPLGFVGAEAAAVDRSGVLHRLGHIGQCLDYAVELGASGLLLGPIFSSSTHGYDTLDHFSIHGNHNPGVGGSSPSLAPNFGIMMPGDLESTVRA
jgi:glycosidase